jgi:hypothetical protein
VPRDLVSPLAGIIVCLPLSLAVIVGGLNDNGPQLGLSLVALAAIAAGARALAMRRAWGVEC